MKTFAAYAVALVLVGSAVASAMSIETDPVKVTHRNSGPRYDIDESERVRQLMREEASARPQPSDAPPAESPQEGMSEEVPAVGRVAIRRIFLFPIMRTNSDEDPAQSGGNQQSLPAGREQEGGESRAPMMFAKPFWPFMTPARPSPGQHQSEHDEQPHIIRHLLGADQASRSPNGAERDQDKEASSQPERSEQPVFDPIQMMLDMMHQAISSQLGQNFSKDLSNSSNNNNNDNDNREPASNSDNSPAESSAERPQMPAASRFGVAPSMFAMKPGMQNETREDVVEIEGKKYLRKTVVSRHVGDNIVFMTRRLIFVPLNETSDAADAATTTTTTTTEKVATQNTFDLSTTSTASPATGGESEEVPSLSAVHRVGSDKPATSEPEPASPPSVTTTTTQAATEQPITTKKEAETTPQPTAKPVESTSPPEQPASGEPREEKPTVPKAADRLVEGNSETTSSKPTTEDGKLAASAA